MHARRGSMYDPARDTFTDVAEEGVPEEEQGSSDQGEIKGIAKGDRAVEEITPEETVFDSNVPEGVATQERTALRRAPHEEGPGGRAHQVENLQARDLGTGLKHGAAQDVVVTQERDAGIEISRENVPKEAISVEAARMDAVPVNESEHEVAQAHGIGGPETPRNPTNNVRHDKGVSEEQVKVEGEEPTAETAPVTSSAKRKRSRSQESAAAEAMRSSPSTLHSVSILLDASDEIRSAKKVKTEQTVQTSHDSLLPMTARNLPKFAKRKPGERDTKAFRRSRSPQGHEGRDRRGATRRPRSLHSPNRRPADTRRREPRSPARRHSPSPKPIARSPSPLDSDKSPPRKRKRPGVAARIGTAEKEAIRQRQAERDEQQARQARADAAARGVHDVVTQHYNAVPQRGREWRKTDSKIKGLRSLNNWVKSAIIQKFSPNEDFSAGAGEKPRYMDRTCADSEGLLVLDIGCGKGGDLQKWQSAPQHVALYVGLDPAEISINQARQRYFEMQRGGRGRYDRRSAKLFHAELAVKDCFGQWLGDLPIIQEVGIDGSVGPDAAGFNQRFGGGGFDVVSMMFCMHYAFEDKDKARMMLRNVAGTLKKGGRFLGVIPNSDVLTEKVEDFNKRTKKGGTKQNGQAEVIVDEDDWDPEQSLDVPSVPNGHAVHTVVEADDAWDPEKSLDDGVRNVEHAEELEDGELRSKSLLEWGNSIYRVKFPGKLPEDGVFRPPYGWKYFYFLEEAVEEIPEYVVPWEAFRALAEEYNLELLYRKPFNEIWDEEQDDPVLGPLSERMNVRERGRGPLLVSDEEMEAASFYHAFCFYKV